MKTPDVARRGLLSRVRALGGNIEEDYLWTPQLSLRAILRLLQTVFAY
jgi:hypothetical protein